MDEESVCGEFEAFVFYDPKRADAIVHDASRGSPARNEIVARNLTTRLANEKRLRIDEDLFSGWMFGSR